MLKRIQLLAVVVLLISAVVLVAGEPVTVKGIVSECAEAMGGMEKIDALKTIRLKVIYTDHDYPVFAEIRRPNLIRSDGGKSVVLFDGKRACKLKGVAKDGSVSGPRLIKAEEWKDFEVDVAFYFPAFFDYPARYVGMETDEGRKAFELEVKLPLGARMTYFIDAETHLWFKTVAHVTIGGKEHHPQRIFSDYKVVGGILYPHGFIYNWTPDEKPNKAFIEKVEFNVPLPDERFAIPAGTE